MNREIQKYLRLSKRLGRTAQTIDNYRTRLETFARFAALDDLRDLNRQLITNYQSDLIERGLKPSSRSAFLTTLRSFLKWIAEEGLVLQDLSDAIEVPRKIDPISIRPLSQAEVMALLESVKPETPVKKRYRAMLEVLYGTGIRRAELAGLKLADVDFEQYSVRVRGKGRRERVVPVCETTLHYVNLYLDCRVGSCEELFTSTTGNPAGVADVDRLFHLLNKGRQRHVHPHLLRHCYAVHMLKNGAEIRVLQELLGHADIDTTQQYLQLVKDDIKAAYDMAMGDVF